MKRLLAVTASAAALVLGGCWSAETDIDVVGDAELREPVLADGTYCLIDLDEDGAIARDACLYVSWQHEEERHAMDNHGFFGVQIPWAHIAELEPPYHAVQLPDPEGDDEDEPNYVVGMAMFLDGAFAVLPRPSEERFDAVAAEFEGVTATAGDYGGFSIDGGEPEAVRAFLSALARAWSDEYAGYENAYDLSGAEESEHPLVMVRVDGVHTERQSERAADAAIGKLKAALAAVGAD
jgi:hypothetical protein